MRPLTELYSIVLELYNSIEKDEKNVGILFICNCINKAKNDGLISEEERNLLRTHFKTQKPTETVNPEFLIKGLSANAVNIAWWYMCMDIFTEGWEIRTKFLERMVEVTKNGINLN